jgi:hypothetical protein
MEVNEQDYDHFQSLSPMQENTVQDLMALNVCNKCINNKFIYFYF